MLKITNVHHYLCTHALIRRTTVVNTVRLRFGEATPHDGSLVKSMLYASTARDPKNMSGEKSRNQPLQLFWSHSLFGLYINKPRKVSRRLCIALESYEEKRSNRVRLFPDVYKVESEDEQTTSVTPTARAALTETLRVVMMRGTRST